MDPRDGFNGLRSGPLLRWLGTMSTRNALLALVAATLVGIVATLIAGSEPGFLLGFFVTIGSVAAVLGIRRGVVYLMFPLPAFALFLAALITGKVHDSSLTSSTAGLGVGGLQWIADVFFPMVIATVLVVVIGGARWLLGHQLVIGQFPMSADRATGPQGARPEPGGPRRPPSVDPWDDAPPPGGSRGPRTGPERSGDRPGTAPRPSVPPRLNRDTPPPDRSPRDQRADRDPWGDPRQPPASPRPRDPRNPRPAPPGLGRGPNGDPRDRDPRDRDRDRDPRPQARDPWGSGPQQSGPPPRNARPQAPRDPWDQRLIPARPAPH